MAIQKYDIRRPETEGGGFEERHWSLVNSPVFGDDGEVEYILHCVEDVTQLVRLRAEEKLARERSARAEERYSQLLDTAPDAMVVVDRRAVSSSSTCGPRTLFGYARAELIGQPLQLLVPDRFRARTRRTRRASSRTPAARRWAPAWSSSAGARTAARSPSR